MIQKSLQNDLFFDLIFINSGNVLNFISDFYLSGWDKKYIMIKMTLNYWVYPIEKHTRTRSHTLKHTHLTHITGC